MLKTVLEFITANTQLISTITIVFGGLFAFVKWLDSRNRELKEKRYSKYMELISIISGYHINGSTPKLTEQIAAVWFLLEYKEYQDITYKIFFSTDLEKIANKPWIDHVVPHIKLLLQEIFPHIKQKGTEISPNAHIADRESPNPINTLHNL